ncbi:maltodextrin phosphorylase, partial [Pseudomonas syringae pv. syringae FF5]
TGGTLGYTNHTLLPEALETWSVGLMERMLPRHMQIIYLINAQHIDTLRAKGVDDVNVLRAVSLIEEDNGRRVRMGNLAFLGSHSVNGVSALHTQLMRKTVFAELHKIYPERINNKTNGITFRRWLFQANPKLTEMLVESLGEDV